MMRKLEQHPLKESTRYSRLLQVGIWLLWMGVIFYFSTQTWSGATTMSWLDRLLTLYLPPLRAQMSGTDVALLNFTVRKLAHFTEYAILTVMGFWAWRKGLGRSPQQALRLALLGTVLFAISDELHQLFVPARTSLYTDVLIDCLGASASTGVIWLWLERVSQISGSE